MVKAHLGRITEDTPEHQGVVVYNMADVPLVSLDTSPAFLPGWRLTYAGADMNVGIWSDSTINIGYAEIGSIGDHRFSSSGCRGILKGRRHNVLMYFIIVFLTATM